MFGKNHLFHYDQLREAWDELHEICLGNYDDHHNYKRSYSAFELEENHPYNITGQLSDEAIDFIGRQKDDEPFFCWVNWQDPHPAFTCPEPYASMFDPDDMELPPNWKPDYSTKPRKLENWQINSLAHKCTEKEAREAIAMYMGQCRYVDDQVGKLVKYLEDSGKLDNTMVVFLGDHGELLGDHGVFHKLPLFYECLSRIPAIIRYPKGMAKPFAFDGLVEQVDLAPTILEGLGVEIPQSMVGESFHEAIVCGDGSGRESALVEAGLQLPTAKGPVPGVNQRAPHIPNSYGPGAMVCDRQYKLSMYCDDKHELYDLQNDPHEMVNLYGNAEYADVQAKMMEIFVKRTLSVGVRPDGAWRGEGVDVRRNPIECREPKWSAPEMYKRSGQSKTDDKCVEIREVSSVKAYNKALKAKGVVIEEFDEMAGV